MGGAGNVKHTHTHTQCSPVYTGWMEPLARTRIERNPDTCRRGPPLIQLMGYEHREDAVGGGGSGQCQTHTHTHTHSVPRDKKGGRSFGQGSYTILTNIGMAPPLIKSVGYEHREDAVGGVGAGNVKHKHTHTHTVSSVIHWVD